MAETRTPVVRGAASVVASAALARREAIPVVIVAISRSSRPASAVM